MRERSQREILKWEGGRKSFFLARKIPVKKKSNMAGMAWHGKPPLLATCLFLFSFFAKRRFFAVSFRERRRRRKKIDVITRLSIKTGRRERRGERWRQEYPLQRLSKEEKAQLASKAYRGQNAFYFQNIIEIKKLQKKPHRHPQRATVHQVFPFSLPVQNMYKQSSFPSFPPPFSFSYSFFVEFEFMICSPPRFL